MVAVVATLIVSFGTLGLLVNLIAANFGDFALAEQVKVDAGGQAMGDAINDFFNEYFDGDANNTMAMQKDDYVCPTADAGAGEAPIPCPAIYHRRECEVNN